MDLNAVVFSPTLDTSFMGIEKTSKSIFLVQNNNDLTILNCDNVTEQIISMLCDEILRNFLFEE